MHLIRLRAALAFVIALTLGATNTKAQSYVNFEGKQTRPICLSPDGTRMFAMNTSDARLSVLSAVGFSLEQTASLAAPAWSNDTNAVEIVSQFNFATNNAADSTKFFRLRQQ